MGHVCRKRVLPVSTEVSRSYFLSPGLALCPQLPLNLFLHRVQNPELSRVEEQAGVPQTNSWSCPLDSTVF